MQDIKEILIKISELDISKLDNSDFLNFIVAVLSLSVSILSFVISIIVLFYAWYQFVLKAGSKFYGAYSVSSSIWSKQSYIGELIIENAKDKSSAINNIYLRINSNIYLELVDYSASPRIIGPFETIKITLQEGVSGYISSTFKVDIDAFLKDRKIKKTLMISTSQGIFKVKLYEKFWNVYVESLRNQLIIPVRPVKKYYNGKEYSDSLKYVVLEKTEKGNHKEHFLYDRNTYLINNLSVKTDDFSDANTLKEYLVNSAALVEEMVEVKLVGYNFNDFENYKEVKIHHFNYFVTNILGRAYTKIYWQAVKIQHKFRKFTKTFKK